MGGGGAKPARPTSILEAVALQNVHTPVCAYTCMHACTCMYMLLNVHTSMHVHTHVRIHPDMTIIFLKKGISMKKQIYTCNFTSS